MLQTHTICNICCFSTVAVVTLIRLNVTLIRTSPVLLRVLARRLGSGVSSYSNVQNEKFIFGLAYNDVHTQGSVTC
jgi:hypothetical protein